MSAIVKKYDRIANLSKTGGPGRPKGCKNKSSRDVRERALRLVMDEKYVKKLQCRLLEGTAGQMEILLWYYAYGKPKESLTVDVNKETNHYHFYIPDNSRQAPPVLVNGARGPEHPMEHSNGHANGHDPVRLPGNGRTAAD